MMTENKIITVDEEISLIPYFPNEQVSYAWYQDRELCKQVDNIDDVYSTERLRRMYEYLSTHGECYYIDFCGDLVGDVSLTDEGEVAIVICREYQNRHIGRRCISAMISLAKGKGMEQIKAHIYDFNTQSKAMFLKAGFVQEDKEIFIYKL